MATISRSLRLRAFRSDSLNVVQGSSGEIYYDSTKETLRVYSGSQQGGRSLMRADLSNAEIPVARFYSGNTAPAQANVGDIWLNSDTGRLYIRFNDGTSTQWIQPIAPTTSGGGGGGGGASSFTELTGTISASQIPNNLITPSKFNLNSSLVPTIDQTLDLGSNSNRWRDLYLSNTGLNIGSAQITASGSSIVLPSGSSVGSITFTGTTIDSSDSSAITFTPSVSFESDISVGTDILFPNGTRFSGSYNDLSHKPTGLGSVTFAGSTINTIDLSDITIAPEVIFSSNISVQNIIVSGEISSQGSGIPEIVSDNEILLDAGTRVGIVASPIKLASFTSAARDLLVAQNGDMIYNTTTNKFQGRANGVWVDLH